MAQNKSNASKVAAAGVAGAVIGGAAVAAAVLSDEKTRKKVGGALSDLKDQAMEHLQKQEVQKKVEQITDSLSDKKDEAEKSVSDK